MGSENIVLTKAGMMDRLMETCEEELSGATLIQIIREAYGVDLESISDLPTTPRPALDAFLKTSGGRSSGAEARRAINALLGVNLDALSALDGARLSIHSKGRWMIRGERDLFEIHTGSGDIDVRIAPTGYYAEQTGSGKVPPELVEALVALGYRYEADSGECYFAHPAGEAVPDAFKGQTIAAVLKVTRTSCSHL
ncbi:hypothetical protein [Cohnella soli]|uniref:Uncharacterized protein n=1 Tax=Cohnella soli TaxID=425005 RepID=A0ABW0HWG0_9BACL